METEHWRRLIAEEWVTVVAGALILVASALAVATYGWGYEPPVPPGLDGGLLAAAGLLLAGGLLFVDLLADYASA